MGQNQHQHNGNHDGNGQCQADGPFSSHGFRPPYRRRLSVIVDHVSRSHHRTKVVRRQTGSAIGAAAQRLFKGAVAIAPEPWSISLPLVRPVRLLPTRSRRRSSSPTWISWSAALLLVGAAAAPPASLVTANFGRYGRYFGACLGGLAYHATAQCVRIETESVFAATGGDPVW
jgi:hypothetical protein